ncbi:MAG: hypothetical protein M0Q92_08155 [Methanoregula sp.]|jgi:hypothetical protein|nr:hypothetical protein [Methanoregula sp.]
MVRTAAQRILVGKTPEEKVYPLGITHGATIDVRKLGALANTYALEIVLFFEEDLARSRTLESVRQEYGHFPEFERPYIDVNRFLAFTRENDPSFETTMDEFPLLIEIIAIGERPSGRNGGETPFVTGLMPFLDELDVDAPPPDIR